LTQAQHKKRKRFAEADLLAKKPIMCNTVRRFRDPSRRYAEDRREGLNKNGTLEGLEKSHGAGSCAWRPGCHIGLPNPK
jgi:hypothetical protein